MQASLLCSHAGVGRSGIFIRIGSAVPVAHCSLASVTGPVWPLFGTGPRGGTTLSWTLIVDEPVPDGETTVRMRKRVNELINANLRFTFDQ
ncbi:hypothetical protein RQCS_58910 (plasmid) [Rhodococcus qingshengii]|uniref:hypothetical protein n=1 Tax=Rhodococcus qingshengii TaxID=334542 RepID=UPI0007E55C81|nr:hypothetical protein [Rhodococcus qingshengii]BCF86346.1 hypothetical protein RQCS_58910 [Rhodococcus qingshengii]